MALTWTVKKSEFNETISRSPGGLKAVIGTVTFDASYAGSGGEPFDPEDVDPDATTIESMQLTQLVGKDTQAIRLDLTAEAHKLKAIDIADGAEATGDMSALKAEFIAYCT
jgi:hypothetical protein